MFRFLIFTFFFLVWTGASAEHYTRISGFDELSTGRKIIQSIIQGPGLIGRNLYMMGN